MAVRILKIYKIYCGIDALWSEVFAGVVAGVGSAGAAGFAFICAPGSALCETGVEELDRGGNGPVVIALSGFSRWSWLGPSPRLISARESGTVFDCQP